MHLEAPVSSDLEQLENLALKSLEEAAPGKLVPVLVDALAHYPTSAVLLSVLYVCLERLGNSEKALEVLSEIYRVAGVSAEIDLLLGKVMQRAGCNELARSHLQLSTRQWPMCAEIWYLLGRLQLQGSNLSAAEESLFKALELEPERGAWFCTLGNVYGRQKKLDAALLAYEHAETLLGLTAEVSLNIALLLHRAKRIEDSVLRLREAVGLNPSNAYAKSSLLYAERRVCDWSSIPYSEPQLNLGVDDLGSDGQVQAVDPFIMLPIEDNPLRQLQRARQFYHARYLNSGPRFAQEKRRTGIKLRVGYVGSDFHDHATAYLLSGVLREHDKEKFEIFCLSYDANPDRSLVDSLISWGCQFYDLSAYSDEKFQSFCHTLKLDVAVDLKGYTTGGRVSLFTRGIAPVQVNYLGFPGTLGSDVHDFIIGDNIVTPKGCEGEFSERIVRLPVCYQPNDFLTRKVAQGGSRSDYGLPENAVVLCSFNGCYKISPEEYAIWLQALRDCDSAVLWIYVDNSLAIKNLKNYAALQGVNPERIIEAPPLKNAEHLARLKCADLFLDTFNVNAHTTATDALFMGVPVLTRCGEQFAARVAASILGHLGLSNLVATNSADYKEKLLAVVGNRTKLLALKKEVKIKVESGNLFNAELYVRELEKAYCEMCG